VAAVLIGAIALLVRIPCQSEIIQEWDAGNFVLAIDTFDLRLGLPHLPGTFVVFVMLGRLVDALIDNPHRSLVWVNTMAGALASALAYLLARRWGGDRAGWSAGAIAATSPLMWFYSETALSYTAEFAWVLLIVLAADQTGRGDRRSLFVLAVLMGLAGGIRPNTPVFLLPLAVVATGRGVWLRRQGLPGYRVREVAIAVAVGTGALFVWVLPMLAWSGGWDTYWELANHWLNDHSQDAQTWQASLDNAIFLLKTMAFVVGLGLLPLGGWAIAVIRQAPRYWHQRDWRAAQVLLWLPPGVLYLVLVHFKRQGHSFTIAPAIVILSGLAIAHLADHLARDRSQPGPNPARARHWWLGLTVAIATVNALFFLIGPTSLRTLPSLRSHDAYFQERIATIRQDFPPETTAVLASKTHGRIPDVYLRDYQEPRFSERLGPEPIVLGPQVRSLILLDDLVYRRPEQDIGFRAHPLPSGAALRTLTIPGDRRLAATEPQLQWLAP
jgi:hypothetical protein